MRDDLDIWIREVGPRDGLQSIPTIFSTDAKLDWIKREAKAGIPEIEVGSFVPPKHLPQMADTGDVVPAAKTIDGLYVSALVPNLRGAQNGLATGVDQLNYVLSVSEAHNQSNVRRSVQESLDDFGRIVALRNADEAHHHIKIGSGVATAFGCTISGPVPVADIVAVVEGLIERGVDELMIADTVGYGNPAQCREIFKAVFAVSGELPVAAHFHDTRGLGLANVDAALEAGVRRFDASLAGLGGCPYAPGASGNIVTDDLVFMLESMGLRTGVDLDLLLDARRAMEQHLNDEPTHGAFAKAGPPKGFVPASFAQAAE